MISFAARRALEQIPDPRFIKILLVSALLTLAFMALFISGFGLMAPELITDTAVDAEIEYWDQVLDMGAGILYWIMLIAISFLLFPAVLTGMVGLFLDQVIAAVESRYYEGRIEARRITIGDTLASTASLLGTMALVHLLALIPYIILFFTTGGLGTLALALLINGFILGREYYDMVMLRYMDRRSAKGIRQHNKDKVMGAGFVIAGLFAIPFVAIIAPIFGAAMMTHVAHALLEDEGIVDVY